MSETNEITQVVENRLVFCENPVLESLGSSRISKENSEFDVYPEGVTLDFEVLENLQQVLDSLTAMNSVGIHIMGSRGYIYSSDELAKIVEEYLDDKYGAPLQCLPRTFGLRAKVRELIIK